jgi:hypothetical protein
MQSVVLRDNDTRLDESALPTPEPAAPLAP